MELDEGVLEVPETGHEQRGFVGPAETTVDLECANIFASPFGAAGGRLEISSKLPEIARLRPPVEILE
jgi:hypothetical protein